MGPRPQRETRTMAFACCPEKLKPLNIRAKKLGASRAQKHQKAGRARVRTWVSRKSARVASKPTVMTTTLHNLLRTPLCCGSRYAGFLAPPEAHWEFGVKSGFGGTLFGAGIGEMFWD